MKAVCTFVVALALAAPAAAQAPANPLTAATKSTYDMIKANITKSAEKVSEEQYSFKPSPDVRTFGQIIGHIADANYMICSAAGGNAGPKESIEKTKTSKADLQKALAESFSACDAATRR
jgi:ABC-type transporter MlaC component